MSTLDADKNDFVSAEITAKCEWDIQFTLVTMVTSQRSEFGESARIVMLCAFRSKLKVSCEIMFRK